MRRHSVLIVDTPPGVDPRDVALSGQLSAGVCWVQIEYGPPLQAFRDDQVSTLRSDRVDHTRLAFRDGTRLAVTHQSGPQTLLGWRAEIADATFKITVALPLEPVDAARVLADAQHVPVEAL